MSKCLHFFSLLMISMALELSAYELSIISMFRNEAPYLKEWIEYHSKAGVDHFYLYDNNSTDNSHEVLNPYIEEGLVEVTHWPSPPESVSYLPIQIEAFKNGIIRAIGNSQWVALIDIDEFILPMQNETISQILNTYFYDVSGVYVNWRNFGTGGIFVPQYEPFLFKLTACSLVTHSDNGIGKSILRPECVNIEDVWYPHHFPLKEGEYVNGNREKMHFVGTDLPTDGKHNDKYLRINHYVLRDEGYYQNVRLARAKQGYGDLNLLIEHYTTFSQVQDTVIIDYIRNNFPDISQKIWESQ